MKKESIEKIYEDWFNSVASELPPELRDVFKERVAEYIHALLSGEEPEKIVGKIDDRLVEKIIRSGSKPVRYN